MITLDGESLTIAQLVRIARGRAVPVLVFEQESAADLSGRQAVLDVEPAAGHRADKDGKRGTQEGETTQRSKHGAPCARARGR